MRSFMLVVGMFSVACTADPSDTDGTGDGFPTGSNPDLVGCTAVATTDLAADEVSPGGFSANDVLAHVLGAHPDTLAWADGGTTPLTLDVALAEGGKIQWIDYEYVSTGSGTEMANVACADALEIDLAVAFATEDGAFAENWTGAIQAVMADQASFYQDLDAVSGSFDPWEHVAATNDYDDVRAWLNLTFDASGVTGAIDGQGSGQDGTGSDGVAWAESLSFGSWGPQ